MTCYPSDHRDASVSVAFCVLFFVFLKQEANKSNHKKIILGYFQNVGRHHVTGWESRSLNESRYKEIKGDKCHA